MLAEFVQKVADLAVKSSEVQILHENTFPGEVFVISGGQVSRIEEPTPQRKVDFFGLSSLVSFLKDPTIAPSPEVYVSPYMVIAFLDGAERRACAAVKLRRSAVWSAFSELDIGKSFAPVDAVKFLRQRLGIKPGDGEAWDLLTALRNVSFRKVSDGVSVVEHGREHLGRSVESTIAQAERIPEYVKISVSPFSTVDADDFQISVGVMVWLDTNAEKVELRAAPDDVVLGLDTATEMVRSFLEREIGRPVFLGAPHVAV